MTATSCAGSSSGSRPRRPSGGRPGATRWRRADRVRCRLAISSLLPASRREQELADQAQQVAQDKVQPVAQVAGEVRENLRDRPSRPSNR
jgi:hypothetical protein